MNIRFRWKKKGLIGLIAVSAAMVLGGCEMGGLRLRFFPTPTPSASEETLAQQTVLPEDTVEAQDSQTAAAQDAQTAGAPDSQAAQTTGAPDSGAAENPDSASEKEAKRALLAARKYAAQYNYNKAIRRLKKVEGYEENEKIMAAIADYRARKAACVEYPLDQITHVFFHTLVVDPSKAFDGDYQADGYNQMMTTVSEFEKMIQIMYDRGYVLVSPHDMAVVGEDGKMKPGRILVPEGKIPFVLSEDDVSYYHYMDGDGFATKLVLDGDGKVKCEYIDGDGNVLIGNYDVVPILDEFIAGHPDFSYHGRKGILAMTGYNGVLGYRTDSAYQTGVDLDDNQREFLENHPDFDFDQECRQAKEVADAMKKTGWEFASHTWGHRNATTSTAQELQTDNERWVQTVAPILGSTDMVIFAFGADIGNWEEYTYDNPKFAYFKNAGYNYFCNVDSSQYWVQITENYFRQGRRNLDGYRMYHFPEMLSDLFDVKEVWDDSRPVPVPTMG